MKALCKSDRAYTIVLCGRSLDKAKNAVTEMQSEFPQTKTELLPMQVDIEDDDSIKKCFEEFSSRFDHLDILINNAGMAFDMEIDLKDISSMRKNWNRSWDLNVTGTNIMTHVFAPLLIKSSDGRLLFLTSGTSTLKGTEDSTSDAAKQRLNGSPPAGWPKPGFKLISYRSAKTGMNMMAREWVKDLKNDGVKVFIVSPGFLATGVAHGGAERMKKMGAKDPALGGNFIKAVIEGERDADAGFIVRYGDGPQIQPW